jgi:hypothetical protein
MAHEADFRVYNERFQIDILRRFPSSQTIALNKIFDPYLYKPFQ